MLIDEYDKPIIEHLGKGESSLEIAKENRNVLKSFFGTLKSGDVSSALRFVFITGISKFARVSIFSDLNNLNDISMNKRYSTMLGYTEEELLSFFSECISQLSRETGMTGAELTKKIGRWYDGYQFTALEKRVYNPFSVVRLFEAGEFENFWFETATPSFLVNLIKEQEYPIPDIENLELAKEDFTVYELDNLELEALLFQTGYITIHDFDNTLYRMGYPNQEVKTSFLSYLFRYSARLKDKKLQSAYKRLHICLDEKNIEKFIDIVKSILASIPYVQIAGQGEDYYHTVFYLMLSASGVTVHTEVLTSTGRIDIAVEFDDKVYILEFSKNN
ncbi:MAG: AAA family ATPase [Desulfobacterales bacterium]|nr:AAA family ATPase [Desulfobacterales bacterium]